MIVPRFLEENAARLRRCQMWAAIFLAAGFPGFCGPSQAEECAVPRLENTVGLVSLGKLGEVGVPITLDGSEKKFLLDTGGGSESYVSTAVARELKLSQGHADEFWVQPPQRQSSMDLRGNISNDMLVVKDVALGQIKSSYVPFQIAPDLPYDGILSVGTMALNALNLGRDDLDFDFGDMKLNVFSAEHCSGNVVYWPHQALAVVPVTLAQGHIELPVMLDGHPLTAVVDTGTPWTIVNLARAGEKLGFSTDPARPQSPDIPNDDPARKIYFRKFSTLSFQGVTVTNPVVTIRPIEFGGESDLAMLGSHAQHMADNANRRAPDIIIGMEILRHLHIYYAVKEQKLYITPANS